MHAPEGPPIHVVTDSTSDIPTQRANELGIPLVNGIVMFGDRQYTDRTELTVPEFYQKLADPREPQPTTASPGIGGFIPVYERTPGKIFSIHVATKLSGFHDHAVAAVAHLKREDITVYDDSTTVSLGLGFMAEEANRLAGEGYPMEEIIKRMDDMRARTDVVALLDTLKNLQRSGRMSLPKLWAGSLLGIKASLRVKDGVASELATVRTKSAATMTFLEWIKKHAPFERIGVVHANAPDRADEIIEGLSDVVEKTTIVKADLTYVLAAHIGPGAVGVCFVEAHRSAA